MNLIINQDELDALTSSGPTIVKFFAPWCGPCRRMDPIVERSAKHNPQVAFVSCNIDEAPKLARKYNVSSIPCIKFFSAGGELVDTITGITSLAEIQAKINKL